MIYRRHTPPAPLRDYVEFLWFFEQTEGPRTLEHVLPDGSFELVINLLDDRRKHFDRQDLTRYALFQRAWISGAHSRYIVIDRVPQASMVGAHFKPGGAAAFLGPSAAEFQDRVVELDAIWGRVAGELRERLIAAPDCSAKFTMLEDCLLSLLDRWRRRRAPGRGIAWATERFCQAPEVVAIGTLADSLGVSHKHFIDQFREQVGLTPKLFCRIQRFQRVLSQIQAREAVDWADVACACGYYDQAHFVHDFQAFSGLNPAAYLLAVGKDSRFLSLDAR